LLLYNVQVARAPLFSAPSSAAVVEAKLRRLDRAAKNE
jgi:hypothetical protein